MTDDSGTDDAGTAARLIGYGFRPKHTPARDDTYKLLVKRYHEDPDFALLVRRCAAGLGLKVIGVSTRSGMVHAALPGSPFETKMDQFARQVRMREHRDAERVLFGITHLAIAALAFPRREDLADDGYVGRVTAVEVTQYVRSVCDLLAQRATDTDEEQDPPADAPGLDRAWRVYLKRPEIAPTRKGTSGSSATRTIAKRALTYLFDRGMLTQQGSDPERPERLYRTTHRYQLQVRELAATRAYEELLTLGVPPSATDADGLRKTDPDKLYD
ncbi:hypothetical protein [Streptomyces sp. NPDC047024]|uniref:hypothetical protein n=1 Tax=Streptomyces sp. NPDC047024 TaxID=3155476 RepID=UPI0033C6E525